MRHLLYDGSTKQRQISARTQQHGLERRHILEGGGRRWTHLLLEVGLVDAGKGLNDDGDAPEVARLERRVLAAAALAVIVVPDDDPLDVGGLVVPRHVRHAAKLAIGHVVDLHRHTLFDTATQPQPCMHARARTTSMMAGRRIMVWYVHHPSHIPHCLDVGRQVLQQVRARNGASHAAVVGR